MFKFGADNCLIEKAVRYGSEFTKPAQHVLRRHKATAGEKMLKAEQLHKLIGAADVQLRAMVLLGLNCGFGNSDVASLPLTALDLERGWATFPRPKTGIDRRCPLWPETVAALREVIATRPQPQAKDADGLVFVNDRGRPWVRVTEKQRTDLVTTGFSQLLKAVGQHRPGMSFYCLRHVHRTVSDGARDPVACDLIMGHADHSMAGRYRERIDDTRLVAVADHVRAWLFGKPEGEGQGNPAAQPEAQADAAPQEKSEPSFSPLRLFVG